MKSEIAKINKVITKIVPPNFTLSDLINLKYESTAHIQYRESFLRWSIPIIVIQKKIIKLKNYHGKGNNKITEN